MPPRAQTNALRGTTDNDRQARCYQLTASGRRALRVELNGWRRFAVGLEAVLRTAEP